MSDLTQIPLTLLDGSTTTFGEVAGDGPVLVVNVALPSATGGISG